MKVRYTLGGVLCLVEALAAVPAAAQRPAATAFVDVSVVPMDRERVLPHQTVLVRGDRIVALGPVGRVEVPAAAMRVDGRGKFLIPGLADMHAHIALFQPWNDTLTIQARRRLFRYVAGGVTTIRDMGGKPVMLRMKALAARGAIVSPRIYVSIRPPSEGGLAMLSARPDSAVRLAKQAGYDLIKFWSAPTGAELDSILAIARRVGLPIAGHAPNNDNLLAIQEHYRSVEHLLGFWGFREKPPANVADRARLRATAVALKNAGVWVCPTLNHMVQSVTPPADSSTDTTTLYDAVRVLHEVGVELLAGTDAMLGPMPGHLVHDELERLVTAGLTPYDALATATRNPAAYFGTLDSTGTVAARKRADLVLLAGNPLADIRYTGQPAGVMLGGRWLPRAELDRVLALLPDPLEHLQGGGD